MKNYKATLYGAVVYSVIIGAIYVTLSILGLLTRWCVLESKANPLVYMMYLIYFRVDNCDTDISWNLLNIESTVSVQLPAESEAVHRTFIFLVTYLGLHAALIVISLYSLCGVNNSCLGRRSFPIFFVPWLVVLVAIIVLDILATVYYIIDAVALTSVDGLMSILEVNNVDATLATFEQISAHYIYLPPIIMLITTAKIFLLFITNIVWIVAITKAGWTASTYHKYLDKTRRNYESTMASVNPAFESLRDDAVAQKQHERQMEYISDSSMQESTSSVQQQQPHESVETRYKDTTQVQAAYVYPYQMGSRNEQKQQPTVEDEQNAYKIKRPTTLILPVRQVSSSNESVDQEREIDSRMSRYQETSGNAVRSTESLKYDDVPDKQHSNTRVLVLPPISEMNNRHSSQKPVPPPKPQTNRFSVQPSGRESPVLYRPERTNSARVDRSSSSVRAPEELRSQLPWSYFKPRDEAPKKAYSSFEESHEVPAVPVPDYNNYGRQAGDQNSAGIQRY